jgi:hypothetical protein
LERLRIHRFVGIRWALHGRFNSKKVEYRRKNNHHSAIIVSGTTLASKRFIKNLERATRIELAFSAWEADVLPLNYARAGHNDIRPGPIFEGSMTVVRVA